jgi:CheY-like chemotaxis protein
MVLQEMLKRLHISSAIVPNGAEAVEYVRNFIPDAILMDCDMPVLNGLEATRIIRDMKIAIPIVAVTANGPEKERECMEAGMTYFLNKPVAFRTLEQLIRRLQIGDRSVDQ